MSSPETDAPLVLRSKPATEDDEIIDSPCWGSPTRCSLVDLLKVIDRSAILFESDDYLVLNKPPDLRMDGDYPSSVHKLLTYWYPSDSIREEENLLERVAMLTKLNDLPDNALRPCHQLDYATSGVLLVGRNKAAAGKACEAFRDRTTHKVYLAVVHSHLDIQCPTLKLTEKDIYHHIRLYDQQVADRRKAHRKTFNGFQPVSSIYYKWKNMRHAGRKRPRDLDMLKQIDEGLSKDDANLIRGMAWGEIKKHDAWKLVFENAAKVFNDSLKEEHVDEVDDEKKLLSLPTVFRLESPDVFYVNASVAQQLDQFAMIIHPQALNSQESPDASLDFKLAITKCTIIKYANLNDQKVTKIQLQPLTGRRHQLRCHMAVIGAPIVGDVAYKGLDSAQRMCLHAFQLKIEGLIDVEAPDPFLMRETELGIQMI